MSANAVTYDDTLFTRMSFSRRRVAEDKPKNLLDVVHAILLGDGALIDLAYVAPSERLVFAVKYAIAHVMGAHSGSYNSPEANQTNIGRARPSPSRPQTAEPDLDDFATIDVPSSPRPAIIMQSIMATYQYRKYRTLYIIELT